MRAALTAVVLLITSDAGALTVTECGESDGYAYYFSGGLVPSDKSGWRKDGISGGRIVLNFANGEADLLVKDASGSTRSVKQDGGKILVRNSNNGLIAVSVLYEGGTGTIEYYTFQIDDHGDGTVVTTLIRAAGKVNKMSLMKAPCRGPR